MVNYIFENKDDAMKKSTKLIDIIQRKAPEAVAGVIKSVNNFYRVDDEGFGQEIQIFSKLCGTDDFKEGVGAFQEKEMSLFQREIIFGINFNYYFYRNEFEEFFYSIPFTNSVIL